jgi:hypothetical protein
MTNEKNISVVDVVGSIEKGFGKKIEIRLMEYNGRRYLDLRTFEQKGEKWVFTIKGITLGAKSFNEFMQLLSGKQEIIDLSLNAEEPET